jgi:hypothetical protein
MVLRQWKRLRQKLSLEILRVPTPPTAQRYDAAFDMDEIYVHGKNTMKS